MKLGKHNLQLKLFSFITPSLLWPFIWFWRSPFLKNPLEQRVHLWFFSFSECSKTSWVFRFAVDENVLPQIAQDKPGLASSSPLVKLVGLSERYFSFSLSPTVLDIVSFDRKVIDIGYNILWSFKLSRMAQNESIFWQVLKIILPVPKKKNIPLEDFVLKLSYEAKCKQNIALHHFLDFFKTIFKFFFCFSINALKC